MRVEGAGCRVRTDAATRWFPKRQSMLCPHPDPSAATVTSMPPDAGEEEGWTVWRRSAAVTWKVAPWRV